MTSHIPIRKDLPPIATLRIPRCKPGATVFYNGRPRTIQGIVLRGYDLMLKLNGDEEVSLEKVTPGIDTVDVYMRQHTYWDRTKRHETDARSQPSPQNP